jgi:hypothetical protein
VVDKLPTWEAVIKDPEGVDVPDDVIAKCIFVFSALSRVEKDTLDKCLVYVERMEKEWQALFCKTLAKSATKQKWVVMNDKFKNMRHIVNCLRVFITTNDRMAMFIPEEDRRCFIMHSPLKIGWFLPEHGPDYFARLFGWLDSGGAGCVAAWLAARDLSAFNPKAPPAKTTSWVAVTSSWGLGEDDPIDGALEALGRPGVVFSSELAAVQFDGREDVLGIVKSPRKLQHRMERAGYVVVPRPAGQDRWSSGSGETGARFRSRMAFVKDVPELYGAAGVAAVEAAMKAHVPRPSKPRLVAAPGKEPNGT